MAAVLNRVVPDQHTRHHDNHIVSVGSNEGKVATKHLGWMRPTDKDTPLDEMRRRLHEDGYLLLKHLIPRQDVLDVRKHYFTQYLPTGMIEPDTKPEDGIFNKSQSASDHGGIGAGDLPPTDLQVQTLVNSHTTPEYLSFLTHTDLRSFVRRLMGWEKEVLLQRTMLRHNAPGAQSTAVHYDKLFLRGGSAYFLTAWVPLGDTAQNGGGLMYLADSTGLGREIEDEFSRRAETLTDEERISAFNVNMEKYGHLAQDADQFADQHGGREQRKRWLVANYEAGDVVFHDPYMIHTSTMNEDVQGRIRLSTDLRFYEEGSDMDMRWMKFWTPGDGL